MLTPEQLQNLPKELTDLYADLSEFILRDIARRIAKGAQITEAAEYQIYRARSLGLSEKEIAAKIAEINGVSVDVIDQLIRDAAAQSDEFDRHVLGADDGAAVPLEDNEQLQKLMAAQIKETAGACENITGTMGFADHDFLGRVYYLSMTDMYRKELDAAHMKVVTGATDYMTAIRSACNKLAASGVRTIDYESGHSDRVEVAVRRALMTSVSHITQRISEQNAEKFGADGWEISAHSGARPSHAIYQGRQYPAKDYERIVKPLIEDYNCRHSAFPIIIGVSEPVYTEKELQEIDPKPFAYEGKTYTAYQAQQQMRKMERAMRKQKDRCITADAAGDKDGFTTASIKLRRQKDIYEKFCKAADSYTQYERTFVAGYDRRLAGKTGSVTRKQRAADRAQITLSEFDSAHKAQGSGTIDWSMAKPQKHTQEQLKELVSYAESKGLHIFEPGMFDGDIDILKEQIDAIHDMREEFGLKSRLTLTFKSMSDGDFAETFGRSINFNTRALRDRDITNAILRADNYLAANDIKGISIHEAGHLIAQKYGNKGLDIATKAYYNIYGKQISTREIIPFLKRNVSQYCGFISPEKVSRPFKERYYAEVIPEVLSKERTNGDAFTHEFVRLLKEMIS